MFKGSAEGPGEEHQLAQTTLQFVLWHLKMPTLSQWGCRPKQQARMPLLAGCKPQLPFVSQRKFTLAAK
jgi:hypothetical protein